MNSLENIERLSKLAGAQSQNFPGMLSLPGHRLAAERLRANPELLAIAKTNLKNWLSQNPNVGAWLEWQGILETESLENILNIITAETDEGQRLRSSSPFAGLISQEERRRIIEICAEAKPF